MRTHPLVIKALKGRPLRDFSGMCGEIADQILHATESKDTAILHVGAKCLLSPLVPAYDKRRMGWTYHQVAVIDGLVIHPWNKWPPSPPDKYVKQVFPRQGYLAELFTGDNEPSRVP